MSGYSVTRTHTGTGATPGAASGLTIRQVGQIVAYCAADNLGMSRQDATREGMAAERAVKRDGGTYVVGPYRFVVTR